MPIQARPLFPSLLFDGTAVHQLDDICQLAHARQFRPLICRLFTKFRRTACIHKDNVSPSLRCELIQGMSHGIRGPGNYGNIEKARTRIVRKNLPAIWKYFSQIIA